ncbi:MAG: stage IV sporulation protein A, partial [Clostridiaceae bacterium]|nr:stage IV sporulation protein A [Clostridiaceae bacterium]
VIPNIDNEFKKERAIDELPQSAHGRTIMTTEPKFVPNEAVEIKISENVNLNVRMIDCVGYTVKGAMGYIEDDAPRMVNTPWFEHEVPLEQAAEIGTKKVITEHSTIGIVITTDGSITEIEREEYVEAENRVINELKEINKPFVVLLNTTNPQSDNALKIKCEIEEKHGVAVMPVNCAQLSQQDINGIIERALYEFSLTEMTITMPAWMKSLDDNHYVKKTVFEVVKKSVKGISKIREAKDLIDEIERSDYVKKVEIEEILLGKGSISLNVCILDGLFYDILSETSGIKIQSDDELMSLMIEMGTIKQEYDKYAPALKSVREKGYGIVSPTMEEMMLEDPEIVKQGNRYGVRLRASAPSIHMIRADIETEISPIVGTERQSEELIRYLLTEFDDDPIKIWQSNIFGKSLHELVNEGLHNKLAKMPEDAQAKLQETLQRIINEGSVGLICIIL